MKALSRLEGRSGILRLAAPLVLSFWLRSAFAWIDPLFAAHLRTAEGHSLAEASIAAIGLTLPFEFLMIACWVGASNGLTARLATALGAGEGARVEQLLRAARRVVWILCAIFLLLAALLWLFGGRVGLDPVVTRQFRIYSVVLLGGSAFTSFWSVIPDSLVKAHHDTRTTMWAGLLSSTSNVALNAFFVFVVGWGILGIALSTVLGRLAGLAFAMSRAAAHERRRRAVPGAAGEGRDGLLAAPVRAILAIAIPSGMSYVLMALESQVVNLLLARQPNATSLLAAWSIYDRSVRFMAMPAIGISVAMLPLVARRFGAGDRRGIRRELRIALLASTAYALFVTLPAAWALGPPVLRALFENPQTRALALRALHVLPMTVLGLAPVLILRAVFDGIGRARIGLVVAGFRAVLLVVPLVWVGIALAPRWDLPGLLGACWGFTIGVSIASLLAAALFRRLFARSLDCEPS